MAGRTIKIPKPIHAKTGVEPKSANNPNPQKRRLSIFDVPEGSPPVLVPESPLINFLSKLTPNQRRGIKNIQLCQSLGYKANHIFPDAEILFRWLTPGDRLISNFMWPSERYRKKWFRIDLTAPYVFQFAETVVGAESMKKVVGSAYL